MVMERRPLGSEGFVTSAQGLGCMGMTAYGADPASYEEDSIATIGKALELGVTLLDTAWAYQHPSGANNEELVGKALKRFGRANFQVATKFGIVPTETGIGFDSSPDTIRQQLSDSLSHLGVDYIDLYYQHRADPKTPTETVMHVLKELVKEGKIRYIGLSECTPNELRRAHAVHPITAIQMEWNLATRDIEAEVVPAARELGVGIVAYSPLGRGLLSQALTKVDDLAPDDWRRRNHFPRFSGENMNANVQAASRLADIAKVKGVTPGQLALAYVHSRGHDVFPIPGTKSAKRVEENAAAASMTLTAEEVRQLESTVSAFVGDRAPATFGTWDGRV